LLARRLGSIRTSRTHRLTDLRSNLARLRNDRQVRGTQLNARHKAPFSSCPTEGLVNISERNRLTKPLATRIRLHPRRRNRLREPPATLRILTLRPHQLTQRPLHRMQQRLRQTDRKSTRLNSSHVKISYAVFCFKKK